MSEISRVEESGRAAEEARRAEARRADVRPAEKADRPDPTAFSARMAEPRGNSARSGEARGSGRTSPETSPTPSLFALLSRLGRSPGRPGLPTTTETPERDQAAKSAVGKEPRPVAAPAEEERRRRCADAPAQRETEVVERPAAAAAQPDPRPDGAAAPVSQAPAATPTITHAATDGARRLDPAALQSLVAYAAVIRDGRGSAEFRLGLGRDALGGARIRLQALGGRRIVVQLLGGREGGGPNAAEIEQLRTLLGEQGLEVSAVELA